LLPFWSGVENDWGFFLIRMLMESFGYPALYSWLLSVILGLYPFSVSFCYWFLCTWVSIPDINNVLLWDCSICRVNWLLCSQVCILSSYSLLLWLFHVLTVVLLSSFYNRFMLIMGVFFFLLKCMLWIQI
jgi:hypothetical protein